MDEPVALRAPLKEKEPIDIIRINECNGDHSLVTHRFERLFEEIDRLQAALAICAAPYTSPPCTVGEGAMYVAAEFQRRMNIAAEALTSSEREA